MEVAGNTGVEMGPQTFLICSTQKVQGRRRTLLLTMFPFRLLLSALQLGYLILVFAGTHGWINTSIRETNLRPFCVVCHQRLFLNVQQYVSDVADFCMELR